MYALVDQDAAPKKLYKRIGDEKFEEVKQLDLEGELSFMNDRLIVKKPKEQDLQVRVYHLPDESVIYDGVLTLNDKEPYMFSYSN